jgi:RND superfamily putative drug exporter
MLIIPAAMHLLGKAAWWLPKWLDRILPNVDVEGASLERTHPHAPIDATELGANDDAEADADAERQPV